MFQRSAHDGLELVFVNIVGKLSGRIDFFHKRFLSEEVGFYRLMKNLEYVAVYDHRQAVGFPLSIALPNIIRSPSGYVKILECKEWQKFLFWKSKM